MAASEETTLIWLAMLWHRRWANPRAAAEARNAVSHLEPAVVVTGGSRGIGEAIARRFLLEGHHIAIVGRNLAELKLATDRITATQPRQVVAVVCDVSKDQAFVTIEKALADNGLYLDILVNNAAAGLSGPFVDHDATEIDDLVSLNISALTRLCRLALPKMLERQQGGILNIASLGGYVPGPYQAAYYASKSFVISLSEALAAEYSGYGVRISVVAPGPIETRFHAAMGAQTANYLKLLPMLSTEQVAAACYRGFRFGRRVIIPGSFNSILAILLKVMPHTVSIPIVGWLLKNREK